MDFSYGLGMGVLGTSITIIGFFIAFLVINYNRKKEKQNQIDASWILDIREWEYPKKNNSNKGI